MPKRWEDIWEYYKKLAELIGTNANGTVQSYSVSWFYDTISKNGVNNNLNNLTKAFLGDEESLKNITIASIGKLEQVKNRVRKICDAVPYPAQLEAISNALLNDITIIQGPPGTGKTETIKEILLCIRKLMPDAKIAIVSTNSEAINNAEDAVKKDSHLKKEYVRLGHRKIRETFKENLYDSDPELYNQLTDCSEENDWLYPSSLLERYPILFSTIHSLRKCVDIDEYDYVIVDECSQVPSIIGMIAIASAKHLILLGDDEQLPPIHKNIKNDKISYASQIRIDSPWYLDEKDNSFMKACKQSFGDKCISILLNEHYRCHPAIINFCSQCIYDNKLIVRTVDDGKLPIRVRWYEGDYWENIDTSDDAKTINYNKKQIEVFIKDELPDIINILKDDNDYSVCVLSPYRYQLELLKKRLDEVLESNSPIENKLEEEIPYVNDIAQLTIHKAQGRGYDLVYIMPVEDDGQNPWSQKKQIVNVAVSRAKRELCIITSAMWMSKTLQEKLLGYSIQLTDSSGEYFIKKLLSYVEKEQLQRNTGNTYGFVRTSINSIFDKIPFFRKPENRENVEKISAPEYCLKKALENNVTIQNEYKVNREVPLKTIKGITSDNKEVIQYIDNGARFDFVITKSNTEHAIIEVDGSYHRSNHDIMHNDGLKNLAVRSLGKEFAEMRFIRFPTDGTTKDEVEEILERLEELNDVKEENLYDNWINKRK